MNAPFTAPGVFVNPDAILAAASFVQREWGHTGYATAVATGNRLVTVFEVAHFDGSHFNIAADKWGNARGLSDDVDIATAQIAEMTSTASAS